MVMYCANQLCWRKLNNTYIMSESSQNLATEQYLRTKKQMLPSYLQNNLATKRIMLFESIGTFIFIYGICCSQYLIPSQKHIPNPFHSVFISCALFMATSFSGPFTGGHVNPAVTLAFIRKSKDNIPWRTGMIYMLAQFIGGMIGAFASWNFFDSEAAPYYKSGVSFLDLFADTLSEILGSFFFTFFLVVLHTKQTTFITDTYWKFIFIPTLLYICRTFSFRIGCLNPAIGLPLEIVQAIYNSEPIVIVYSLTMVIGPFVGALLSAAFFEGFYRPIYVSWKQNAYSE